MVSRATLESNALIFRHQPMPVDIRVDHVHPGILEMVRSVQVGSDYGNIIDMKYDIYKSLFNLLLLLLLLLLFC